MKKRFKILKIPILIQDVTNVNNMVMTCVTLHNMLLDVDSQFQDGNFTRGIGALLPDQARTIILNNTRRLLAASDDFSGRCCVWNENPDLKRECDPTFKAKRDRIAQHMWYMHQRRLLQW